MPSKKKYGDIVENHDLVKRTLMVAAFPALIRQVSKDGEELYEGFLPGFEFSEVSDFSSEDELVETLQDMLDDEVEELVVFGKSLPNIEEDDELLKKHQGYKIVYLDINVYASKDDLEGCTHDCHSCSCGCHDDFDEYDEFEEDEDCDCGCHHHGDEDDCDCDDECDCDHDDN